MKLKCSTFKLEILAVNKNSWDCIVVNISGLSPRGINLELRLPWQ